MGRHRTHRLHRPHPNKGVPAMTEVLPNGIPADSAEHYRSLGLWTGDTH